MTKIIQDPALVDRLLKEIDEALEDEETRLQRIDYDLAEVVKTLRANGDRLTGEDGGIALMALLELKATHYEGVGLINYGMGQLCELVIHTYVWKEYKFVVQESIESNPDAGGTVYYATVDLYNNGDQQ
tara:strand:+ start:34 stop:420 length:387 start_codon:yes stop_codon:yes gene_type:complete